MSGAAWKPTYDLYRTREEAERRAERIRKAGYGGARVRRVAKASGAGRLVLNPRYTVDYTEAHR